MLRAGGLWKVEMPTEEPKSPVWWFGALRKWGKRPRWKLQDLWSSLKNPKMSILLHYLGPACQSIRSARSRGEKYYPPPFKQRNIEEIVTITGLSESTFGPKAISIPSTCKYIYHLLRPSEFPSQHQARAEIQDLVIELNPEANGTPQGWLVEWIPLDVKICSIKWQGACPLDNRQRMVIQG